MSEKEMKRLKEVKNKGFKTEGDNQIPEPIYFTKSEGQVKAADPRDREEDPNTVINDYTSESIAKESNSTKNSEAKLRTTSDKEC